MKNTLLIVSILLLFSSCEKYVDGFNQNPNDFTDAPGELIIGQAELAWAAMFEGEAARLGGVFTDQFTGFSNQFTNFESYDMKSTDYDGVWTNTYTRGLAQTRIIQEKALQSGNTVLLGISQIIEASMIAETAALFGDIPYSQSAQPTEFPNPVYDNQDQVLSAAQNLLSEGISNVGASRVRDFYGGAIFVQNNATWAQVAHSLKARYFLIAKQYTQARDEAKLGIASKDRSLLIFHSATDGQRNLFYQFGVEQRGGYLTVTRSHLRKMLNLSDTSTDRILFTPGEQARFAKYFSGNELNYNEDGYFAQNAPFPLIDWYENQLILAEAEYRIGNEEQARAAFNVVRTELAKEYNAEFPAVSIGGSTLLRVILEEKYITLIGSLQVYHDVRRTNNLLRVPVKNNTARSIPLRFLYPQVEINTNKSFPGVIEQFTPTRVNS